MVGKLDTRVNRRVRRLELQVREDPSRHVQSRAILYFTYLSRETGPVGMRMDSQKGSRDKSWRPPACRCCRARWITWGV